MIYSFVNYSVKYPREVKMCIGPERNSGIQVYKISHFSVFFSKRLHRTDEFDMWQRHHTARDGDCVIRVGHRTWRAASLPWQPRGKWLHRLDDSHVTLACTPQNASVMYV